MDRTTSQFSSIDLMKQCLSRLAFHDRFKKIIYRRGSAPRLLMAPLQALLRYRLRNGANDPGQRWTGVASSD